MLRQTLHIAAFVLATGPHVVLFGCAAPPPPPRAELEARWDSAVGMALRGTSLDQAARERIIAYAAMVSYEGHAADNRSGLLSLSGQLNGLWNVPLAAGAVDGAIVAATAQGVLLDSLFSASSLAATFIDSLATSITTERRELGVSRAVAARSLAHGIALGNRLIAWVALGHPTLVLRHARECTRPPQRGRPTSPVLPITLAGDPAPPAPSDAAEAAERRLVAAMTRADLGASVTPAVECVDERVRGRLRTRAPTS